MTAPAAVLRLMQNLRVHLPGAVDSGIILELFNTLNEFFTVTRCWREEIEVTALAATLAYTLTPTDPGTIISLMSLTNENDTPVAGSMQVPGTLDFVNQPNVGDVFTAEVALTVVDPVDADAYPEFPDWLMEKYYAGIMSGVLGKMMAQPAKVYSNERMAVYHTRSFRGAMANARAEARHKNLYRGQRWTYPGFA